MLQEPYSRRELPSNEHECLTVRLCLFTYPAYNPHIALSVGTVPERPVRPPWILETCTLATPPSTSACRIKVVSQPKKISLVALARSRRPTVQPGRSPTSTSG